MCMGVCVRGNVRACARFCICIHIIQPRYYVIAYYAYKHKVKKLRIRSETEQDATTTEGEGGMDAAQHVVITESIVRSLTIVHFLTVRITTARSWVQNQCYISEIVSVGTR